jgi:ABC-type glutathione transport system ATPase component
MNCLRVSNVSKRFTQRKQAVQAVDRVSLSVHTGESVGIIGSSGCGKTTLINLILGLLKPDSESVHHHGPAGMVSQDPYASLCPSLSVAKAVAEPLLFLKRKARFRDCVADVRAALASVNMPYDQYAQRLPSELSGGERQRVGIARALIMRPSLLLLDEPTSMLDQDVKDEVAQVIRSIARKQQQALLMVTHDIQLAAGICDRILVMSDGRIIEEQSAEEIMTSPQQELTRDFIMISNDIRGYWRERYDFFHNSYPILLTKKFFSC